MFFDGELMLVILLEGFYGLEFMFVLVLDVRLEDDGYVLEVVYNVFDYVSELYIFRV